MNASLLALLGFILLNTPLAVTAQQSGDFTYVSDGLAITITGYTGPGGVVTIPDTIGGLPVRTIGGNAFYDEYSITSVTIPGSVTSILAEAFEFCFGLTSLTIPGSVRTIGAWAFNVCVGLTNVTILNGVTAIGPGAFNDCQGLTRLTIPGSVNNIGDSAFNNCGYLEGVFFAGNAPDVASNAFYDSIAIVYYVPGATGWGAECGGVVTRLWNPLLQSSGPGFGVGPAGFGFNITGTPDIPIVVEAAANLANAAWVPLQSLDLTNGALQFSDPSWTNYPARHYRIRSP
jgi:hypothetical protein